MKREIYDRRVARTRKRLMDVLAQTLSEKPLTEISVRELCEAADINRSTFYLHFSDLDALHRAFESELFEQFRQSLSEHVETDTGWLDRIAIDDTAAMPILLSVYRFLLERRSLAKQLAANDRSDFLDRFLSMGRDSYRRVLHVRKPDIPPLFMDAAYDFFAAGCIAIIRSWVLRGMVESPEEMTAITSGLIARGNLYLFSSASRT